MSNPRIDVWHILFSGFLQTEGEPTGMVALWHKMHEAFAGARTCVLLREWNSDIKALAELVWRLQGDGEPRINLYSYSWGGMTAVKFAEKLRRRGLAVQHMVLCDAVYRHGYPLGNWRAYRPYSVIRVSQNVEHVWWFRQMYDWPRGHDVIARNPQMTKVHDPFVADLGHTYIDDLPDFHRFCLGGKTP